MLIQSLRPPSGRKERLLWCTDSFAIFCQLFSIDKIASSFSREVKALSESLSPQVVPYEPRFDPESSSGRGSEPHPVVLRSILFSPCRAEKQ